LEDVSIFVPMPLPPSRSSSLEVLPPTDEDREAGLGSRQFSTPKLPPRRWVPPTHAAPSPSPGTLQKRRVREFREEIEKNAGRKLKKAKRLPDESRRPEHLNEFPLPKHRYFKPKFTPPSNLKRLNTLPPTFRTRWTSGNQLQCLYDSFYRAYPGAIGSWQDVRKRVVSAMRGTLRDELEQYYAPEAGSGDRHSTYLEYVAALESGSAMADEYSIFALSRVYDINIVIIKSSDGRLSCSEYPINGGRWILLSLEGEHFENLIIK
ncbi:hypothetical protein B9479_008266, partial [Cryptococcus floricola]